MISEPELVGGADVSPPLETLHSGGDPAPRTQEEPRRPWLWAVGGAVLASALWAGGLYAFERDGGPDQRGYGVTAETCEKAPLSAITERFGARDRPADSSERFEDPAYDRSVCQIGLKSTDQHTQGWPTTYRAGLVIEQHRRTDPGPELEARLTAGEYGTKPDVTPVEGLGDRAFHLTFTEDYYVQDDRQLVVQDGGVVLVLSIDGSVDFEGEGEEVTPTYAGVPELLESDMRELMTMLKK
ncbi:hypothetical protein [Streptomyces candidus]|uniref:DUF3558 domain-containing protein n=1 Tax=Streptomyces candidus TaxID=67283 RepID=A0A7X0HCU9_9ACTN|nr:hypothetical protein [Streptomyces candidus]MBB6435219.1 hypothetical protein [Streptomyces candidus]GHH40411.1 hypothetical protein GCM10018773_21460 [Streptomyces candidus]